MTNRSHDAIVRALCDSRDGTSAMEARDAFIASLGSASLRFRSVLGHYAYAANFPRHRFEPSLGEQAYLCNVCGLSRSEDLDADEHAAFRAKGDFSLADPVGAMLDLEDFKATVKPTATNSDFDLFDRMLAVVDALPVKSRATALVNAWSFVPRTNRYSRANMIATLGACGLFETIDHPSHLTRWVSAWEYEESPGAAGDMRPPEAWWTRADGVNRAVLNRLFRHPRISRARFPKSTWKRAIARGLSKVGTLELAPRDRIGIRFHGRHFVGVVVGAHPIRKTMIPVVEMYRGTWEAWPTENQLAKASVRLVGPYAKPPTFCREPLAFDGLQLYGKVMTSAHFEVLARDCDPPRLPPGEKLPLPAHGYRHITPNNMLFILETLATRQP